MARTLDFELLPQKDIEQENVKTSALVVGRRQIDFSIPDLPTQLDRGGAKNKSQAQHIVQKINQYIENIADDYFLLGVHLITLHKLLKQSQLTTDQIKSWYAENVNMPYSSAMQCKKVAEVYANEPELINRYTASGAYLLSSFKTHEEREKLWEEACGERPSASIRDLRTVLKNKRDTELLSTNNEPTQSDVNYKIEMSEIHQTLVGLTKEAKKLKDQKDDKGQGRQQLIKTTRVLLRQMEEKK